VYCETTLIKQVLLKGLHGQALSFDLYVTLIKQEAHSEQRRLQMTRRSFQQLHLWALRLRSGYVFVLQPRLLVVDSFLLSIIMSIFNK